jgi:hypothetical protein
MIRTVFLQAVQGMKEKEREGGGEQPSCVQAYYHFSLCNCTLNTDAAVMNRFLTT